jgi:hypothetical protein
VPSETPPTPDASALLARLGPDVAAWDLEVVTSSALTPTMRRLRLTAPGLAGFSYQPGQDLMLDVPTK